MVSDYLPWEWFSLMKNVSFIVDSSENSKELKSKIYQQREADFKALQNEGPELHHTRRAIDLFRLLKISYKIEDYNSLR